MSYRLVFAADAQADFGGLRVDVQEAVLDELDRLADSVPFAPWEVEVTHVMSYAAAEARHDLSLSLGVNHSARIITVLGIDYFAEPYG